MHTERLQNAAADRGLPLAVVDVNLARSLEPQ